jgi:hypothetical protein
VFLIVLMKFGSLAMNPSWLRNTVAMLLRIASISLVTTSMPSSFSIIMASARVSEGLSDRPVLTTSSTGQAAGPFETLLSQ